MKILYVITKGSWGGATRYVYDLATAANDAGHDVAILYGVPGILPERLETAGIRAVHVPALQRDVSPLEDIAAYRTLVRLFRDERADVVHLNSSKAGAVGALAARRAGVRTIIFTAHGWAFTESRSWPSPALFWLLQHATVALATRTIAVSAFVRDRAPLLWLSKARVTLIPLGIRAQGYASRQDARRALAALDESLAEALDGTWVGSIAELHPNKGLDIGIEGWKRAHANAAWVILAGGEDEQKLKEQAARTPSIHFLGFVADAAQYMRAFDLLLVPSRTEGLAYVILEAGYAGVPVLCSGVGGTREALGPHYPAAGYFPSGDTDWLAGALKALIDDRALRDELARALESHVRETFSLERMVRETLALYETERQA
jgi:glycosyltransferase involved in cell wall biosynthesis